MSQLLVRIGAQFHSFCSKASIECCRKTLCAEKVEYLVWLFNLVGLSKRLGSDTLSEIV